MAEKTVINIASGKGGTGKTLMAASLGEMLGSGGIRVLLIDLDFFVRGLTSFLYHSEKKTELVTKGQYSVSDFFVDDGSKISNLSTPKLAINTFNSFDVVPAVRQMNAILDFNDIFPNNLKIASKALKLLLAQVPDHYKIVIIDSRAGYDELISATYMLSDYTIIVEEDDLIAKVTADNLVYQLINTAKSKPIYRVLNKARGIGSIEDIKERDSNLRGIEYLGVIPFDTDIMNNFGKESLWPRIRSTLYWLAVANVWNKLNELSNDLNYPVRVSRISPIGFDSLEKRLGKFSSYNRFIIALGITLSLSGFILYLSNKGILDLLTSEYFIDTLPLLLAVFGFMLTSWAIFRSMK